MYGKRSFQIYIVGKDSVSATGDTTLSTVTVGNLSCSKMWVGCVASGHEMSTGNDSSTLNNRGAVICLRKGFKANNEGNLSIFSRWMMRDGCQVRWDVVVWKAHLQGFSPCPIHAQTKVVCRFPRFYRPIRNTTEANVDDMMSLISVAEIATMAVAKRGRILNHRAAKHSSRFAH